MNQNRRRLEELQKEFLEFRFSSPLSKRIGLYKLCLEVIELNGRLKYQLQILERNLTMKLDADVNYLEWSDKEKWKLPKDANREETYPGEETTVPKSLADILNLDTNIGSEEQLFGVIEELCTTLGNIHNSLEKVHSSAKYSAFFTDLKERYDVTAAMGEFTHWRDHEVVGSLSLDKLKEKQTLYISDLLNSKFLMYMEKRCSASEKAIYNQEVDMDLLQDGIQNPYAITNGFACFHQLFYFDGELFQMIADDFVGKYIFDHRKKLTNEQIDSFMKFLFFMKCIRDEVQKLSKHPGLVFPEDFDKAAIIFHENLDVRKICLSLLTLKNEGLMKSKRHWFVVYKYFADLGWLTDKTQTHFLSFISYIFTDLNLLQQDFKEVDNYYKVTDIRKWKKNLVKSQPSFDEFNDIAEWMITQFIQPLFLLNGRKSF